MQFKQCLIFREVARFQNLTKAAENLFMTQSAVSHAIKDLERAVGNPLLERLPRGVRLTAAGKIFLQEIQPIIESYQNLEKQLPNLMAQTPVKIASCMTYAQSDLPVFLKQLTQAGINNQIKVAPAQAVYHWLENGEAELAFLEGMVTTNGFLKKEIARYPISFFCEPNFLQTELTSLPDLLQQPLLVRQRGSAIREIFEASLVLENLMLRPYFESNDSESLIMAAKAGLGLAVLPKILVAKELAEGTLLEVSLPQLKLENTVTAMIRKGQQSELLLKIWQDFL